MTRPMRSLRIAVIAPMRYPIAEPHAGGLESSVWHHVRTLRRRGHRVTVCAVEGSDFLDRTPPALILPAPVWPNADDATDTTYPPGYLDGALPRLDAAMAWIAERADEFDVVDNHCLHRTPLDWAPAIDAPMVTTLHTPALPELVDAHLASRGSRSTFLSVSEHTRRTWSAVGVQSTVLPGAVDLDLWPLGAGGPDLVWSGRIVPEKGPHLAIDIARRLGLRLTIAGRIGDEPYARRALWPHLDEQVRYVGELSQSELAGLVGSSGCALVTPIWEEPFGLVIAEALACGTPVATFATGGVPEVVSGSSGALLAPSGDLDALARVTSQLLAECGADSALRARIRRDAAAKFSLSARTEQLEAIYLEQIQVRSRFVEAADDTADSAEDAA